MAGWTAPGGSRTFATPTETREDDGETHLRFRAGGDQLAVLTVRPGRRRHTGSVGDVVPVDVSVAHRDGTTITGLRLGLRAPPGGAGPPARVALLTPFGTPRPALQL